ncbi:YciI family protein [Actinoallomurus purpureus]|uniref:YciI family protein n=1 Tax=Actinoallomurus purpureus TaxID=478114 RepID=UPI002093F729|nr:YciI family protein [Actinoallomurus purpureus]MCO6006221.1 YciI family protein [Actinoallomurus purpureus]
MKQYMLSVYQPDGAPPPSVDLEKIMNEVEAWRQEVKDAGEWVFTGRLHAPGTATVVRLRDDEMLITDGPFIEGKEHIGGFTIVQVADLDAALDWAEKFIRIAGLPVEVRPLLDED